VRKGAAIVGSLVISITALSLAVSRIAISNEPTPLLADGAIVEANTIESIPDLARAVLTGDPKEVDRWLLKGANVDERVRAKNGARAGFTPIILAAAISDSQIAKMLIENKANITLLDDFHRSAFWYAALNQSDAVTEVLVTARDANDVINAADDDLKRTPLHLAVRGNEVETVKLLLTKGASRSLEDIRGETPVDYCKRRPNDACRLLF
jgi:ankyrin repeat protein